MKYSKEQLELMVLMGLMILGVFVVCFVLFIKPNFTAIGANKADIEKVKSAIDKERKIIKLCSADSHRAEELRKQMEERENMLFHGLRVGRLTEFFDTIRKKEKFYIKYKIGLEKTKEVYQDKYYELFNEFTVLSCNYHLFGKFISALETANPGIRIAELEISKTDSDTGQEGLVDAKFELRLVGFKEENPGEQDEWTHQSKIEFNIGVKRNPFEPPGLGLLYDPGERFKRELASLVVTGTLRNALLIKEKRSEDTSAEVVAKGGIIRQLSEEVRLIDFSGYDYLRVERVRDGKIFKMVLVNIGERRGEVKEIIEEKK